ncbi:hypothetical protein ABZ682_22590 [Streptomyces griseoviridis]|uniref:hypothetical protein n=1 Tax=Streptomyces griseoviridis TaxID=45398 RepID=UPI0033F5F686
MQRSSSHTTVALVGVSAAGGGAALAASATGFPAVEPALTLPFVCLTAATAAFVRRCAIAQGRRVHTLFTRLARKRHERLQDLDAREEALAERERVLQLMTARTQLRVASAYAALDHLRAECAVERERRIQVESEYRELCHEYNDTLLNAEAPSQEAQPPIAVGQSGQGSGPQRLHTRPRGPRPYLTVVIDSDNRQTSA